MLGVVLSLSLSLYSHHSVASNSSLDRKWSGLWIGVDDLSKIRPEVEPVKSVNIYDNLVITSVTNAGFSYRNAGNDVGYGPNEVTYYQGDALYTKDGHAIDNKGSISLRFIQGSKKWDRGITLITKEKKEKYFKQKRTQFETGFNCDKASTHIEIKLCRQPLLARADREMGVLYRQLRKSLSKDEGAELRKEQRYWVKRRNKNCQTKTKADTVCLSSYYASRLVALKKQENKSIGGDLNSVDAAFMAALYKESSKLWQDTVFRLYMSALEKQDELSEWNKYQPKITAEFENGNAAFTGKYQYETIIWPNDVVVAKAFHMFFNSKSQSWLSISKNIGKGGKVLTTGPDNKPGIVKDWVRSIKNVN